MILNKRIEGPSWTGTSGQQGSADELGLNWTHPQEASVRHHTPSPELEPTEEEEERPALQQLEVRHRDRAKTTRNWNEVAQKALNTVRWAMFTGG